MRATLMTLAALSATPAALAQVTAASLASTSDVGFGSSVFVSQTVAESSPAPLAWTNITSASAPPNSSSAQIAYVDQVGNDLICQKVSFHSGPWASRNSWRLVFNTAPGTGFSATVQLDSALTEFFQFGTPSNPSTPSTWTESVTLQPISVGSQGQAAIQGGNFATTLAGYQAQLVYSAPPSTTWGTYELKLFSSTWPGDQTLMSLLDSVFVTITPQIVPTATKSAQLFGTGVPGSDGITPTLRMAATATNSLDLELRAGLGGAASVLVLGDSQANVPLLPGVNLLCTPVVSTTVVVLTGTAPGQGEAGWSWPLPSATASLNTTWQVLILDSGAATGISSSPGLEVVVN